VFGVVGVEVMIDDAFNSDVMVALYVFPSL
jgi:hypothetical protein